jgi:steroid 5-alpha reductase family enzyme
MLWAFDAYNILLSLGLSVIIQLVFFAFAAGFKTDKVTDFSYSLSFAVLTVVIFLGRRACAGPQILVAVLVLTWAVRLGSYLLTRILKIGRDFRFDDRRENFWRFLTFWALQAVTVWLVMLPAVVLFSIDGPLVFNAVSVIGTLAWLCGFTIEWVSDAQKFRFKSDPANRGKWIETGLWKYSRHPNYFGESLLWWGIFLIVLPNLNGLLYLTVCGPIFITLLLLFVSGIPLLEQSADKKFAGNPRYLEYKRKTSLFIPWRPERTGRSVPRQ